MFVVTNTFQPAFTGISSFFFVPDPKITLEEGLETKRLSRRAASVQARNDYDRNIIAFTCVGTQLPLADNLDASHVPDYVLPLSRKPLSQGED
jgi:hypothetical protein